VCNLYSLNTPRDLQCPYDIPSARRWQVGLPPSGVVSGQTRLQGRGTKGLERGRTPRGGQAADRWTSMGKEMPPRHYYSSFQGPPVEHFTSITVGLAPGVGLDLHPIAPARAVGLIPSLRDDALEPKSLALGEQLVGIARRR
jgi:hypothetical protein